MTRKELSQLYYLRREIASDRERLAKLEAAATAVSPSSSGMPGGKGKVSDKTALATEIADLRALIRRKINREEDELLQLMSFIDSIDDSLTRQIFTARFVDGLSWAAVAMKVGGGNTPESVRQLCSRYLHS